MTADNRGKKPPLQHALFEGPSEASAAALVAVTVSNGPASAAQKTFNRLTERIRGGRGRLASWEAYTPRFQARLTTELQPVEDEFRSVQRRLVQQLHALLAAPKGERPGRRHQLKARSLLLQILHNLLENAPDAELEALYDLYSDTSYAERCLQEVDMAELVFGEMLGSAAMRGHHARTVDELARHAADRIAAADARLNDASSGARRRGAGRAAERKAQAAQEASLSVKEIYRKLASALHPDREADALERERKTGLLQRANKAYERNDLLELLTLQIETEQIDPAALSHVPEERLRHYNHVLRDQANALDAEVEERVALFRMQFDLTVSDVTPQCVDQALSARIVQARAALAATERDSKRLEDPRQWRAVLDELAGPEDDDLDFQDLALLAAVLGGPPRSRPPAARRRKRRKR